MSEEQQPRPAQAASARNDGPSAPPITPDEVEATLQALKQIQWDEEGLTRHQIKRRYPQLAEAIYLRLPDSKRYMAPMQVLHDAGVAQSRAEGEFLGPDPDIPERESVSDGGPPAWGGDPIFSTRGIEEGGSREDTEGLDSGS